MIIKHFNDIIPSYEHFIFDIWGVIYDGVNPYPNTIETVNNLLKMQNKQVFFLSNTPRPNDITYKNLVNMGLKMDLEQVITSGDIARAYLTNLDKSTKFYHIGKERNHDILRDINNEVVEDLARADLLLLTAFLDEGDNLDQYDDLLIEAAKLGLKALCPNPDKEIMHGAHQRYCAGFFAQKFERFGGEVKYIGKPHSEVFNHLLKKIGTSDTKSILMIGDTIETDILGAEKAGICSALTLTGNGRKFIQNTSAETHLAIKNGCDALKMEIPTEIINGVF